MLWAVKSIRRRVTRMYRGKDGYQKAKWSLLWAKERLSLASLASPTEKEDFADAVAAVAKMEAILMPFMLAEQAAYEAEEAALALAGSRGRFGVGEGSNLSNYSQLKVKEVNGDGEMQHEAPAYSQPKAKEVHGDGEVQREGLSYSQPKAKEVNGDGEVQHEAPAYSQPKAKDVNGDGEVQHEAPAHMYGDESQLRGQRLPP